MTISELITQIRKEFQEQGIKLEEFNIYDDEDLIMFALQYLKSNPEYLYPEA